MFKVRIHDRRTKDEWVVNFHTARIPAVVEGHNVMIRLPDNGALVSCGLDVPADLSIESLRYLIQTGQAIEVSTQQRGHGGCQSRCVLRGDATCQW